MPLIKNSMCTFIRVFDWRIVFIYKVNQTGFFFFFFFLERDLKWFSFYFHCIAGHLTDWWMVTSEFTLNCRSLSFSILLVLSFAGKRVWQTHCRPCKEGAGAPLSIFSFTYSEKSAAWKGCGGEAPCWLTTSLLVTIEHLHTSIHTLWIAQPA